MEGQATNVVHMRMREQHCALIDSSVWAAPGVKHQSELRQDNAGLLQANHTPSQLMQCQGRP